jgi:hypothetical protein
LIGVELGIIHNVVINNAVRLGLKFPRAGPSHKVVKAPPIMVERVRRKRLKQAGHEVLRQSHRNEWLLALKNNPKATRRFLQQKLLPKIYSWLYAHDRDWLRGHMPPPFKRMKSARQVDWETRDILLAEDVRHTARQLMTAAGPPVQVTVQAIGRILEKKDLLTKRKSLSKLPRTRKVLSEMVESLFDFCVRRISWATERCQRENLSPSLYDLGKLARMTWATWQIPEVNAVLREAWESLQHSGVVSTKAA